MGRDCDCPFFPSLHDLGQAHPCSPSGCRWSCLVCAQDDVLRFQETGFAKPTPSQPEAVLPHGKLWECGSILTWVDQSQDALSKDKESKCPAMLWCRSSSILATWCEEPTHWKRPWCGKDREQEEKGTTEDEMVGWHRRLSEHEFEQTSGDSRGQGSLGCCSPWGHRVGHDWATEQQQQFQDSHAQGTGLFRMPAVRPCVDQRGRTATFTFTGVLAKFIFLFAQTGTAALKGRNARSAFKSVLHFCHLPTVSCLFSLYFRR